MDEIHFREFKYVDMIRRVVPPSNDFGIVWHYTSPVALLAIVEHGEFWASCVRMLNDSAEMYYGLNLVDNVWRTLASDEQASRTITRWLAETRALLDSHHITDSFVLCASTIGDSQPQFSGYGPYAVGLDPHFELEKVVADALPPGTYPMSAVFELGWRRVLYESIEKTAHIENLIRVLRELAELHEQDREDDEARLAAIECIIRATAYVKDEHFAHEHEVRLYGRATLANAKVFFRVSDFGIVPFVKVRSGSATLPNQVRLPIVQINLGPGLVHPKTSETGLRVALRQNGYPDSVHIVNAAGSRV